MTAQLWVLTSEDFYESQVFVASLGVPNKWRGRIIAVLAHFPHASKAMTVMKIEVTEKMQVNCKWMSLAGIRNAKFI